MNKLIKCRVLFDNYIITKDLEPIENAEALYENANIFLRCTIKELNGKLFKIIRHGIDRGDTTFDVYKDKIYSIISENIDIIGYISEPVDVPNSYITHKIRKISEEELEKLNTEEFFIEIEELRNMALTWDKPINSYTTTEPLYSDHLRWINDKLVVHLKDHSSIIRYSEI